MKLWEKRLVNIEACCFWFTLQILFNNICLSFTKASYALKTLSGIIPVSRAVDLLIIFSYYRAVDLLQFFLKFMGRGPADNFHVIGGPWTC